MPDRFDAVQEALRCGSCGGQRQYDPETQGLLCDHCGERAKIIDDHHLDARREMAFDPSRDEEPPEIDHAHQCQTCGGEVVFVGKTVSDRCPYCNGPVVLNAGHAHYIPSGLIPFAVGRANAEAQLRAWAGGRYAAPDDLLNAVKQGDIAAIYAPFWTFDADKQIYYSARKKIRSGKNTRWRTVTGQTKLTLDDMITGASDHVTPAIRDGIMHGFDIDLLRPYLPDYLAGFAAELHESRVSDGLEKMKRDIEVLVHKEIKRDVGGTVKVKSFTSDMNDIRFRRILLPLWILHYSHKGKAYRIITSGIDGKTFGQRPFSFSKLVGYSVVLTVAIFAVGLLLGIAASGG